MAQGKAKKIKNLAIGLGFLSPNIFGFLLFVTIPLVMSLGGAFTNWDLRLHNMFHPDEPIRFVGLDNFIRLLSRPEFYRYLGNTLFFMLGIPFSIAGSLLLAVLMNSDLSGKRPWVRQVLIATIVLGGTCAVLVLFGLSASAFTILLTTLGGLILIGGLSVGSSIYRTLFFLPSFTAGVAVYILWKKLYSPHTGPINQALAGPLHWLTRVVRDTPPGVFVVLMWVFLAAVVVLVWAGLRRLVNMWRDGDLSRSASAVPVLFLLLPVLLGARWLGEPLPGISLLIAGGAVALWQLIRALRGREFTCPRGEGFGSAVIFAMGLMVLEFILLGLAMVLGNLPALAGDASGLEPPKWLASVHWAKPAIMVMTFWLSIGSRNMLLYLAGLSNIPQSLYEACDIDGASRMQRFWNITWPQLAPTTFFIVVMSVIAGLQGGFDMVRTMTQGGPAGATTTLSYFIYTEGFETGRLGYSSAVAWTMFALIFSVTMFNWKFGNRYVND